MVFTVTAYVVNPAEHGCDTFTRPTKTGTHAMRGTVAVDPSVVRFGSALKIPGYGFGRARDTGGAIVGHRLDVAVMSCKDAFEWGRRRILVAVAQ